MRPLVCVLDDVLDISDRYYLCNDLFNNNSVTHKWIQKEDISGILNKLVHIGGSYYDFSSYNGVEVWTRNKAASGFHFDKDENIFQESYVNVFPLCSLIFYLTINTSLNYNKSAYNFVAQDFSIMPAENRMIIIGPGLIHGTYGLKDARQLIGINPWIKKPQFI